MHADTDSDSSRPQTHRPAYRSVAPLLAGLATGVLLGLRPETAAEWSGSYCGREAVQFLVSIVEGVFRLTTAAGLAATLAVVYAPGVAAAVGLSGARLRRLYRLRLDHVRVLALIAVLGPAVAAFSRWVDLLLLECLRVVVLPW